MVSSAEFGHFCSLSDMLLAGIKTAAQDWPNADIALLLACCAPSHRSQTNRLVPVLVQPCYQWGQRCTSANGW